MQVSVGVRRKVNVPPSWLWSVISGVGGVQHWMPGVLECKLQGRGVGAYRYCKTETGWLIELIENIDHLKFLFEYTLISSNQMPFQNLQGSMQVEGQSYGLATLIWKASFEVVEGSAAEVKQLVLGFFEQGSKGLENYYNLNVMGGLKPPHNAIQNK